MQYVILIGDSSFSCERLAKMKLCGDTGISMLDDGDLLIQYENGYARFSPDDDPLDFYSEEERAQIPFAEPKCITLRYNDIDILKSIVSADDFPDNVIIDCDGVYLGLESVIDSGRLMNNFNISSDQ